MDYCEQHPEELSKVASVQKKVSCGEESCMKLDGP